MILEESTSRRDLPKMQMNWNSQNVNSESDAAWEATVGLERTTSEPSPSSLSSLSYKRSNSSRTTLVNCTSYLLAGEGGGFAAFVLVAAVFAGGFSADAIIVWPASWPSSSRLLSLTKPG
jgi:hypothetical protein